MARRKLKRAVIKLSPSRFIRLFMMKADQILTFADTMRAYAREGGRDVNAANLFVHAMLARALERRPDDASAEPTLEDADAG